MGSLNFYYVRSIHEIILLYAACKCSNNACDFLSGSAAAAPSFRLANISLLLYLLPKTLAVRISTILNPSHSRVFHAAFTCQMQQPSPYIIEGEDFGQNSLIFPMIIDYEPLLFKPS